MRHALVLALFVACAALKAADKMPTPAPSPAGPVPIPYPNAGATAPASPRDPASGLATGKRMHKPWMTSASARKLPLADGRVFVVNAETGEVVFGDGLQGRRPETGDVPKDGSYRTGNGAAGNIEVRGGKVLLVPTPAAARVKTK
jgi:hypothetical protein